MVEAKFAGSGQAQRAGPWIVVAIIAVIVLGAHVRAVHHCPLPIYGYGGAEYIEHGARLHAIEKLDAIPLVLLPLSVPRLFQAADGAYPPLLHISAAAWGSVFGHDIPTAVHLNLVFLVLLAVGVASATRNLPTVFGRAPGSWWSASLAASTLLLTPTVFGSARRYYYDLPMAAWTTLAFAAFCRAPLSPVAIAVGSIASAAALLTKWNAGFSLVPLWIAAAVITLRDPLVRRRWRTMRHLAVGGVFVVVLCSPVLSNSVMFRSVLVPAMETVGLDARGFTGEQESSFDISFVQSKSEADGGGARGMPPLQAMEFQLSGLVASALGPLLAVTLFVASLLGWRVWREPLFAAALCLPTALLLVSPAISIQDERFIQPCVPLLLAVCWILWDRSGRAIPTAATAAVAVLAGVVQLAAWDGLLPLGPQWTGRASIADRGWSRLADTECSPHDDYVRLAEAACTSSWNGGGVLVSSTACLHMGIGLSLDRACPEVGYRSIPDDEAADRVSQALQEPGRRYPMSVIVAMDLAGDGWPGPLLELWMPEDEQNPETIMGLYRFDADPTSEPTDAR